MINHHGLRGYKHDEPFWTPTRKRCVAYPFFGVIGLFLLALWPMLGCAASPKVYAYSWGTIVKADQWSVYKACTPEAAKWDDGTKRPKHAEVNGCAFVDEGKCWIWVVNNIDGAKSLPHELAHCDGKSEPDKAGYQWN